MANTLVDAIRALSARDQDYASIQNGIGFNGADTAFGNQMAAVPAERWTLRQSQAVHKMLAKYQRQLESVGISYAAIPAPTAAPIAEAVRARLGGRCGTCRRTFDAGTLVRFVGRDRHHADCNNAAPPAIRQEAPVVEVAEQPKRTLIELPVVQNEHGYDARAVLGPGGHIAGQLAGYEHRPEQLDMAELVGQAIAGELHAVIEAGTGTGKSLGYLVPAILSGARTIVSTADKALQGQIWLKDIPFLQSVMPVPFKAALLKGRGNYVCLNRVEALRETLANPLVEAGAFRSLEASQVWPDVDRWISETESGDVESLDYSLPYDLQADITTDSDGCLGQKCPQFGACFVEAAKAAAKQANVVIVNHALLLRDLEVRAATDGHVSVIPDSTVIVLDEAHHLEEAATEAFGTEITGGRFTRIRARLDRLTVKSRSLRSPEHAERAENWRLRGEVLGAQWDGIDAELYGRLARSKTSAQKLGDDLEVFRGAIEAASALGRDMSDGAPTWLEEDEREAWRKLAITVGKLTEDLRAAAQPAETLNIIRYVELDNKRIVVHVKPIDVADELREKLWGAWPSVIATSATISTDGGFEYWTERVGLDADKRAELIVGSPFDYVHNSLIYLPQDGNAFDSSRFRQGEAAMDYSERMASEIERLILASNGRAFVLFTSYRMMRDIHERLAPRLRYTVLRQGDAPRPALVAQFKADGQAVLFGTKSFWEGVDVQGDALSLVIIDKLPFAPPDDPTWEAKCEAVNRKFKDKWAWFNRLAIPTAQIALKQGFGRLIRTRSDRGVVALLDGRLTTKGYGSRIIKSLPPATVTRSLDAVRAFYGH